MSMNIFWPLVSSEAKIWSNSMLLLYPITRTGYISDMFRKQTNFQLVENAHVYNLSPLPHLTRVNVGLILGSDTPNWRVFTFLPSRILENISFHELPLRIKHLRCNWIEASSKEHSLDNRARPYKPNQQYAECVLCTLMYSVGI